MPKKFIKKGKTQIKILQAPKIYFSIKNKLNFPIKILRIGMLQETNRNVLRFVL